MPEVHRYRNVLRFFIIATFLLVPVAGFAGYLAYHQADTARAELAIQAERTSRIIASQQEQQIRGIRNLLVGVSQFAELKNRDAEGCDRTLALLLDHANQPFPYYLNLAVADMSGEVFCTSIPSERTVSAADRHYFRRAVQTRNFSIGEYQIGRITGKESINFGYPILDETGGVKSVVIAAVSLDALNANASRADIGNKQLFLATDRNGTIILSPNARAGVGTVFAFHQTTHREAEGSFIGDGPNGTKYIFGFTTLSMGLPEDHFHFIVGIPFAQVTAAIEESAKANAAVFGGVIFVALAAGWFLSRRIAERLLTHYR